MKSSSTTTKTVRFTPYQPYRMGDLTRRETWRLVRVGAHLHMLDEYLKVASPQRTAELREEFIVETGYCLDRVLVPFDY